NVAHFVWLSPFPHALTGGDTRYKDKPFWQRAASDLQPLTVPTRFTVSESDRDVETLMAVAKGTCPERNLVVVADLAPVDWRRVMFYLPHATAINTTDRGIDFVGHESTFASLPPEGEHIVASCPVIWLSPDEGPGGVPMPTDPLRQSIPRLGWMTPPGTLYVTPASVSPTVAP